MKQNVNVGRESGTQNVSSMLRGEHLAPEIEEGNREYKLMLTNLTDEQLTHRTTQLNWRLNEGNGEAFYLIGVEDNGNQLGLTDAELKESLRNLQFMADQVGCEMSVRQMFTAVRGVTAEVHMKRKERQTVSITQMAICVVGDVDSGKSTLIGVLSSGDEFLC
jgi:GTPase